jgi:hypothetical protein
MARRPPSTPQGLGRHLHAPVRRRPSKARDIGTRRQFVCRCQRHRYARIRKPGPEARRVTSARTGSSAVAEAGQTNIDTPRIRKPLPGPWGGSSVRQFLCHCQRRGYIDTPDSSAVARGPGRYRRKRQVLRRCHLSDRRQRPAPDSSAAASRPDRRDRPAPVPSAAARRTPHPQDPGVVRRCLSSGASDRRAPDPAAVTSRAAHHIGAAPALARCSRRCASLGAAPWSSCLKNT